MTQEILDNYLFEYCGNLYEHTGINGAGDKLVFSDINNGDYLFVNIDKVVNYFDNIIDKNFYL